MERILDLVPLIESDQLKMAGGISPGYNKWEGEDSTRILEHQFRHQDAECTCDPELPKPKKSDYFPSEPSARSLSKVLVSVSRVRHIDGLSITVCTASCNRRHEDSCSVEAGK